MGLLNTQVNTNVIAVVVTTKTAAPTTPLAVPADNHAGTYSRKCQQLHNTPSSRLARTGP